MVLSLDRDAIAEITGFADLTASGTRTPSRARRLGRK
jgi:hypothetical protein